MLSRNGPLSSPSPLPPNLPVPNLTPTPATIGYCTNVHAGVDLASIRRNLEEFSVPARDASGDDDLGVGLWIPAQAASELAAEAKGFARFLSERRLHAFTINGFPFDNFHQPVVKHRVYQPTWWQTERLDYTRSLADILVELLPEEQALGSISTLPIGWPTTEMSDAMLQRAGANLRTLAGHLKALEDRTGKRIVVAIEPEPGCILDTTQDMIDWFDSHLPDSSHRRYLTVCHDVCHSAVMMEPQAEVLKRLTEAGISIGKVQVSSAVVADWQTMAEGRKREALTQLAEFAEDRYLHQTGRRRSDGSFELAEDLPALLEDLEAAPDVAEGDDRWVVHFHVPIFLERFGHLGTSQTDVLECLGFLRDHSDTDFTGHLEIETYAWTVLPASMRNRGLSEDIASEVRWLREQLRADSAS
ncbi:MAG: metabolite traffic protein EboE [Rubripirellula sp.]